MPRVPDIIRICAEAFRYDPSQVVFLVGAGASVASGLPTAWEFHSGLAKFLAFDAQANEDTLRMLTTGYVSAGERPVRFEQTIAVFRELYDPALRLLTLFDDSRLDPNGLHEFIAAQLARRAIAVTTNFDSLIERAYDRLGGPLTQMCRVGGRDGSPHRFDDSRVKDGCLLKLHGSLWLRTADPIRYTRSHASLGATLDALGRGIGTPGLEPMKEACLRKAIRDRILVVFGYSGSDDFDVLPSLGRMLGNARGVVWIKHLSEHRTRMLDIRDAEIPEAFRSFVGGAVIMGVTADVLRDVLGVDLTVYPIAPRPDIAMQLAQIALYDSFRGWHRAIVIGRLAEIATQPRMAARYYEKAAEMARRRVGDVGERAHARGYALARLGHIHREAGRNAQSLESLRQARAISRRYHLHTLLANVTVSIGNVHLRTARLKEGLQAYREALRANKAIIHNRPRNSRVTRQNIATITSNIGIVFRKRGYYDSALTMFKESLGQARRLRDRDRIVLAVGNLGNAHYHLRNYDSAARAYDEAIALARAIGRRQNVAINLSNRAMIARLQGQPEIAGAWLEEALALDETLPYPEGEVDCLVERARNRVARGRAAEALTDATRALRVARRIGHVEGESDALLALAGASEALGREHTALTFREQAAAVRS